MNMLELFLQFTATPHHAIMCNHFIDDSAAIIQECETYFKSLDIGKVEKFYVILGKDINELIPADSDYDYPADLKFVIFSTEGLNIEPFNTLMADYEHAFPFSDLFDNNF